MSSTPPISESDAVRLSAYLDGELSPAEREALEGRMAAEAPLREELEALRAGHVLLRDAVCAAAGASPEAPSRAFAAFGTRLARALPGELPVAPALKPPRLRRATASAAGVGLAVLALAALAGTIERWGGPPPCGWRLAKGGGKANVLRARKILNPPEGEDLREGDQVLLDAQAEATLEGPAGLRATLRGPATLRLEPGGAFFLTEGRLRVEALDAEAAAALRLRTPDGEVKPAGSAADGWRFQVEVHGRNE